ncbi:MAG: sulfatase-like hydrolase/transferase [Dehalococcoidia bacterium]|nr:sulfatase-like hydrolase/transferase [Dehalococcoidia bacterium]
MPEKPNIVLVFPDQHRADVMGCAGNPVAQTPNLDKLASEGVLFKRCNTNSPLCMPARTSVITGQYVSEHGVWSNNINGNEKGPSHVRSIRDAGYHTAVLGKTHLYTHGRRHTDEGKQILRDWGYTDIHELTGPLASRAMDSPYTDYLERLGILETHRNYIANHGRVMRDNMPWDYPACPLPTEAHLDSYTGREAVKWIQDYRGDKPFYYQVCFPGPHDPYDAPAEYRARYRLDDLPLGIIDPPGEPMSPLVSFFVNAYQSRTGIQNWTVEQRRLLKQGYYGKVTLIDYWVGEIMKALEQRHLLDNTWVIYTSDHGDMLGERCLLQKMVFFEEAQLIPCIIRPPDGVTGWESNALTDQLDIIATLLDIAGASSSIKPNGRSLIPQINAGPKNPGAHKGKEAIITEVFGFSAVRTERYKMSIDAKSLQPVELYDLQEDPEERKNRVNDPSKAAVKKELSERYIQKLIDCRNEQLFLNYLEKDRIPRELRW